MALVYFKALSDETRLRLVHILLHYELSVNELVRILGMGQSRVSRHLKILTEAGLLTSRRDGLWVFYAATRCGEASDFLQAMGPFLHTDTAMREDLAMAAQILEERALKTRQFFNAIAEDWDELNREVLEDFDLPAAVLAAVNLADELCKAQENADNLRRQLKTYLDEAGRAKNEAAELRRKLQSQQNRKG